MAMEAAWAGEWDREKTGLEDLEDGVVREAVLGRGLGWEQCLVENGEGARGYQKGHQVEEGEDMVVDLEIEVEGDTKGSYPLSVLLTAISEHQSWTKRKV